MSTSTPSGAYLAAASASCFLYEPARRLPTKARIRVVTVLSISPEFACADNHNVACANNQVLESGVMTASRSITSLTDDEVRVIDRLRPAVSALFRRFDADLQREQRLSFGDYIALFF